MAIQVNNLGNSTTTTPLRQIQQQHLEIQFTQDLAIEEDTWPFHSVSSLSPDPDQRAHAHNCKTATYNYKNVISYKQLN